MIITIIKFLELIKQQILKLFVIIIKFYVKNIILINVLEIH